MFLVKYISGSNMYRFLSFENNDKSESNTFYIAKDSSTTISNYNKEGWVFNLGCENNLAKKETEAQELLASAEANAEHLKDLESKVNEIPSLLEKE